MAGVLDLWVSSTKKSQVKFITERRRSFMCEENNSSQRMEPSGTPLNVCLFEEKMPFRLVDLARLHKCDYKQNKTKQNKHTKKERNKQKQIKNPTEQIKQQHKKKTKNKKNQQQQQKTHTQRNNNNNRLVEIAQCEFLK